MRAVEIKNLNFNYGNIKVFDNLNFTVSLGKFVTILGKNGSGKTTLAKILGGFIKSDSVKFSKKDVSVVFDSLNYDGVIIDILNNVSQDKINIMNISKKMGIDSILSNDYDQVSLFDKKRVNLCVALLYNPKILVLDDIFEGICKNDKINILRKLKKMKLTVINFTSDIEDGLFSDEIMFIGNGKILLKGNKYEVFKNVDFFEKNGYDLPFIVNLSFKLEFYKVIDKVYFDEKKLVDDLWQ